MADSAASEILYDLPGEFLADLAATDGTCDAQSVLPRDGKYLCHCTCGRWDVVVDTTMQGLELARKHTAETDGQ
jgi:hypothetical protein